MNSPNPKMQKILQNFRSINDELSCVENYLLTLAGSANDLVHPEARNKPKISDNGNK